MADPKEVSRKGEVQIEGDYATVTFKRILQHTPEHVWQAITSPDGLKSWLMCSFAKIDGRTGGSIEMRSGPAQFHVRGKILTWEPPRVYEHEWKVEPVPEMRDGESAIFRYELEPQDNGTLLTVIYKRLTKRTALGFAPGTHVLLDRLEAQLDNEQLPDWMTRFEQIRSIYPAWNK